MNNQCGGEVIGAGGFGCVFKPQLRCKDPSIPYDLSGISKLLEVEDADEEMEEIENIMPIINNIPNNKYYFLPNIKEQFKLCKISDFNLDDIKDIEKCEKILRKGKVSESLINRLKSHNKSDLDLFNEYKSDLDLFNEYKDKFRIIQQPYGGEELHKYIQNLGVQILDISFLKNINSKLCNLLKNGIKPMNDIGLLHHDIKSENILYDISKDNVKLIDWGLSKILTKIQHKNDLITFKKFNVDENPYTLRGIAEKCSYEVNFNAFPINILFRKITEDNNISKLNIKEYFHKYNNYTVILKHLLDFPKNLDENKINEKIIIFLTDFLSHALTKYNRNDINKIKYFIDIYAKNCDIFGFLSCYVDIIVRVNFYLNIEDHLNAHQYLAINAAEQIKDSYAKKVQDDITEQAKIIANIKTEKEAAANQQAETIAKIKEDLKDINQETQESAKIILENLKKLCLYYMYSEYPVTKAIDVEELNNDLVSVFNRESFIKEIKSRSLFGRLFGRKGGKKTLKKYKINKEKTVKRNKRKTVKKNKRKIVIRNKRKTVKRNKE